MRLKIRQLARRKLAPGAESSGTTASYRGKFVAPRDWHGSADAWQIKLISPKLTGEDPDGHEMVFANWYRRLAFNGFQQLQQLSGRDNFGGFVGVLEVLGVLGDDVVGLCCDRTFVNAVVVFVS